MKWTFQVGHWKHVVNLVTKIDDEDFMVSVVLARLGLTIPLPNIWCMLGLHISNVEAYYSWLVTSVIKLGTKCIRNDFVFVHL